MELNDTGSSSSPGGKLGTGLSESLFRPEPSSIQSESGKQSPSITQQESSSPVLPANGIAASIPVIRPSCDRDSSREGSEEEEQEEEDKLTDAVELSATKTCDRSDNCVVAVDKLTPNLAQVTAISEDKSDEAAWSASGDITVFSGRSSCFCIDYYS